MAEVTLTVPEETLLALKLTPEALGGELRLAAAIKLLSWVGFPQVRRLASRVCLAPCFWRGLPNTASPLSA